MSKTYRKPGRPKRQVCGPEGRADRLPERVSVLVAKRGEAPVVGSEGGVAVGNHTVAVCRVRWGTAEWRRRWHKFCRTFGLAWQQDQAQDEAFRAGPKPTTPEQARGITITIEVFGGPEAVARAVASEMVASWEYRVKSAGMPFSSIGPETRSPKSKPPKPVKHNPFYGVDREVYGPKREQYVRELERQCGNVKMG